MENVRAERLNQNNRAAEDLFLTALRRGKKEM